MVCSNCGEDGESVITMIDEEINSTFKVCGSCNAMLDNIGFLEEFIHYECKVCKGQINPNTDHYFAMHMEEIIDNETQDYEMTFAHGRCMGREKIIKKKQSV